MSDFWQRALVYSFTIFVISLLIWAIADALPAALFFGVAMWLRIIHHLRNLAAFDSWLSNADTQEVPVGTGMWEDVFAVLDKLVKQRRKDHEQYAAALQQMQQATSALPEGVVILDDADRIEWCNPLAERHFGLDAKRDMGQQITYLARQPEFVQYLDRNVFTEPLVLRDTRHEDLVLSIKLIAYGSSKRLLISRDITHLERIETMRRDFVANVSHELRTPLTVVNGFVETMQDMPNLENDMARRALKLMGDQTSRMERLVDDLLTLSRLENEQNVLQEEQVNVQELMHTLLEEGRSLSNGQHVLKLELESDVRIGGCGNELHSAFGNLVTNAVRYTPPGGEVVLRWSEQPDGHMAFSVKDSGIGIAPQHISRLTERFYRVDRSRSRETGGTGLGLAIVKHIAMRHQAQLNISSAEGKGSTFSVVFPEKRRIPPGVGAGA
ncbi:MAG: phosphate regulon sensor histidine kinase PhoR [Sideroxyarcus sp.]|nr:phosphate regulon sensor histidine kinase PhoR [Sideroxyarcus sp.]